MINCERNPTRCCDLNETIRYRTDSGKSKPIQQEIKEMRTRPFRDARISTFLAGVRVSSTSKRAMTPPFLPASAPMFETSEYRSLEDDLSETADWGRRMTTDISRIATATLPQDRFVLLELQKTFPFNTEETKTNNGVKDRLQNVSRGLMTIATAPMHMKIIINFLQSIGLSVCPHFLTMKRFFLRVRTLAVSQLTVSIFRILS
jgi:hypothetical protein